MEFGFPCWICDKLIDAHLHFPSPKATRDDDKPERIIPTIWIKLPFIRKAISRKLHQKCFPRAKSAGEIGEEWFKVTP